MGDNIQHQWILEFLLRQPVENHALNRLIIALSPLVPDHRLMKTLLLRRISSEFKNGIISEKILESLELIEEIDHLNNIRSLNSVKDAYCAVALDCVVRFLKEDPKNFSEYTKAVERIWRGRVLAMEKVVDVCLISEWTQDLRTQLEEAVENVTVCEYILSGDTETDALRAVGLFLSKVFEELGPPFLDVAAKTMSREGEDIPSLVNISIANRVQVSQEGSVHDQSNELDENNRDLFGNNVSRVDGDFSLGSPSVTSKRLNPVLTSDCGEVDENGTELSPRIRHSPLEPTPENATSDVGLVQDPSDFSLEGQVGVGQGTCADALCEINLSGDMMDANFAMEPTPETSVNEIVDQVQDPTSSAALRLRPSRDALGDHSVLNHGKVDVDCSVKCKAVPTPEFTKVKEALQSSITELNNAVTDPLPDALCMAATVSADMAKEVVNNVQSADIQSEVDRDRNAQSVEIQNEWDIGRCDHSVSEHSENLQPKESNIRNSAPVSQPSLMNRNNTARTLEWDDKIEPQSDENPVRPHLPTRQNRSIGSPLKEEPVKVAGRRQKRKWSTLEEDTLRDAVKEFGRGNWKLILDKYQHIFSYRTSGDLKDKWRNMVN